MVVSILIFLLMMTVVVFLHEGGHFLVAKLFNIYTKSFSIGFGPILYRKKFKETEFQIRAIPLGGMVEIPMEYANDDLPKDIPPERLYDNKKPYQKFFVAFAGPAVNVIIAYLLFSLIVSFVGITPTMVDYVYTSSPSLHILKSGDEIVSISGKKIYSPGELSYFLKSLPMQFPVTILRNGHILHLTLTATYTIPQKHIVVPGIIKKVSTINAAGPSHYEYDNQKFVWINGEKYKIYSYYSTDKRKVIGIVLRTFLPVLNSSYGNFKKGDHILKIGSFDITNSYDLQEAVHKYFAYKDGKVYTEITISNNSVSATTVGGYTTIPVVVLRNGNKIKLNMTYKDINNIEFSPVPHKKLSFFNGVPMTNQFFKLSLESLFSKEGLNNISGPVGVAYFVYKSKNAGFMALVNLFALISLGLAIFNFLPIPPLDGSRMLYSLIELIIRRKISPKVQMTIDNIGVILLFMVVIFATYNDILRMFK